MFLKSYIQHLCVLPTNAQAGVPQLGQEARSRENRHRKNHARRVTNCLSRQLGGKGTELFQKKNVDDVANEHRGGVNRYLLLRPHRGGDETSVLAKTTGRDKKEIIRPVIGDFELYIPAWEVFALGFQEPNKK